MDLVVVWALGEDMDPVELDLAVLDQVALVLELAQVELALVELDLAVSYQADLVLELALVESDLEVLDREELDLVVLGQVGGGVLEEVFVVCVT